MAGGLRRGAGRAVRRENTTRRARDRGANGDRPAIAGAPAYFAGAGATGMAGIACNSFNTMAGSMAGAMFCMFII